MQLVGLIAEAGLARHSPAQNTSKPPRHTHFGIIRNGCRFVPRQKMMKHANRFDKHDKRHNRLSVW